MTAEEISGMMNEFFTRLRENECKTSNLCVKLDLCIEQWKTSTAVTDKFLEALDKRRVADEAREAKFWKVIIFLGSALIAVALGKEPLKQWAQHQWPTTAYMQDIIPLHDERNTWNA